MRGSSLAALVSLVLGAQGAWGFVWPNTSDRIARELTHTDVQVRRRAAERLRDLPEAAIRRLAARALADPDTEVRLAAADAAQSAQVEDLGRQVMPWLNETEVRLRLAAAEILRASPTPAATPLLGRVLGDPNAEVRVAAAAALGASGDRDAVLSLLGHLDDTHPEVRVAVVEAVSRLGDARAIVPLIGKIQDANDEVRRTVAHALGTLGDPRAASALLLALRDRDEDVRVAALAALGALEAEDAALAMVSLLEEDLRPAVQRAVLSALARIPGEASVEALVRALGRDDRDERDLARAALVRAGKRAVPRLTQCLAGQPPTDQADGCALALAALGTKEAYPAVTDALRRGVTSSSAAVTALGLIGDRRALALVLEHISASDPFVRRAAIGSALSLLDPARPDGRAVDPIVRALDKARLRRRERAALTALLGETGSPRAAEALVPLATDADDVALRVAAVRSLGHLRGAKHDDTLLQALRDRESAVRLEAAIALRRQGSARTADALVDLLENSASYDRTALTLALVGPMGRSRDGELAARLVRLFRSSREGERDALIEAIGAMPGRPGSAPLEEILDEGVEIAARLKIAEALATHPEAKGTLVRLTEDRHPAVRTAAVWSLGAVGGADVFPTLAKALKDDDVAVAANAPAALGRAAGEQKSKMDSLLCGALADPRSYVRANALAALALTRTRCSPDRERDLLARDPARLVRAAAARLLAPPPAGQPDTSDVRALHRCVAEDPSGDVALACRSALGGGDRGSRDPEPVTVYVVPSGHSEPVPGAPFALVLANGLMRLGLADRRGAVYEARAPAGPVRLEVPAPLAR